MARYTETLVDQYGRPIRGALVLVTNLDGTEPLLSDDFGGVLDNPIPTDALGSYYFNAPESFYNLEVRYGGIVRRRDFGLPIGDLISNSAYSSAGYQVPFSTSAPFTPTVMLGTDNQATVLTSAAGTFTKVANSVLFQIRVTASFKTGGGGVLSIRDLPFTAAGINSPTLALQASGLTTGATASLVGDMIRFTIGPPIAGSADVTDVDMADTWGVQIDGSVAIVPDDRLGTVDDPNPPFALNSLTNVDGMLFDGETLGISQLSIGDTPNVIPTLGPFYIAKTFTLGTAVMSDFRANMVGTTGYTDGGAIRGFVLAGTDTVDGTLVRGVEAQTSRLLGTHNVGTWGIEVGVHSEVAGNGINKNVGIVISSWHAGWTPTGTKADCAIQVDGADGWYYTLRAVTPDLIERFSILNDGSRVRMQSATGIAEVLMGGANGTTVFGQLYADTNVVALIGYGTSAVHIKFGAVDRIIADGIGLGFNGSNGIAKPTVTGSRGGNAALASLLAALASYGLITDSSTA